eukprot:1156875-Pelagomonas_calceolata.AAC.6
MSGAVQRLQPASGNAVVRVPPAPCAMRRCGRRRHAAMWSQGCHRRHVPCGDVVAGAMWRCGRKGATLSNLVTVSFLTVVKLPAIVCDCDA